MLVEINLLPKKTKKKNNLFLFILLIILLIALCAGGFFYLYSSSKEELANVERQLIVEQDKVASLQMKLEDTQTKDGAQALKDVLEWTKTYPIDTVFIMKELIALLPERGFFESFTYNEVGTIQLSVRFDTSRQAAAYLSELSKSKYLAEASVASITTAPIEGNAEEILDIETYLPRYIAQYDLKINREAIQEKMNSGEKEEGLE